MPDNDNTGLFANILGAVAGYATAASQKGLANGVKIGTVQHQTSPYALAILGEANRLKNAPMPGSAEATNNIYQNESNTIGDINRNASSGSQALALVAAAHGQTNNAFNQKQQIQNQYQAQQQQNWNNANINLIAEDDKNYQDEVRNQNMRIQEKNNLSGSALQNYGQANNTLVNAFSMYGSSLFNKNNGNLPQNYQPTPDLISSEGPQLNTVTAPENEWWSSGGFH